MISFFFVPKTEWGAVFPKPHSRFNNGGIFFKNFFEDSNFYSKAEK